MGKIIRREHSGVFRDNPATGHNHTYYSLNDAAQSPEDYVKRCKEMGFKSVALNDHGTLLGVYPFMDACAKYGINGIPGIETYGKVCSTVVQRLAGYETFLGGRTHLIINPINYRGYQRVSAASRDAGMYSEKLLKMTYPIMTDAVLEEKFRGHDDIFATSACAQGAVSYILQTNHRIRRRLSKEEKICEEYKEQYEAFIDTDNKRKKLKEELSPIKKELTKQNRFLKEAHIDKIRKLETKLSDLSQDDKKYEKKHLEYSTKLEIARKQVERAHAEIPMLESEIERIQHEYDALQSVLNDNRSGAKKYQAAKDIMDKQDYIPDDELYECAKIQLEYYKSIFGKFFIEIQYHGLDAEEYVAPILLRLADETGTPIIAANDAHVAECTEDWFETRRIMRYNYFGRSETLQDADRELYIKSDWELIDALSAVIPLNRSEEAVRNTDIFNECRVEFPQNEKHYPSVKTGEGFDELLEKARDKKIRAGEWNDVYEKRLRYEINTIKTMGYVDYHMVVMDFCNESRILGVIPREEIPTAMTMAEDFDKLHQWISEKGFKGGVGVGPGRGSGAGSLVCYLLGITNIDPVKYGLLFERFLNPERVSMPDIDSDIKTSIRPLIIKYLQWKNGEKAVCSIATETTYAARASIQMAGRERASQLYGHLPDKESTPLKQKYLYGITQKITEIVPERPGIRLDECEKDFNAGFKDNKEAEIVWKHARLLEGRISGTGIHAGGVIISDNGNVNDYIALAWNSDNQVWAAQCDMIKVEEIGLLKMDLLGLTTLDTISDTIHLVKKYRNVDIDIEKIGFEDEVFSEIYSKGNTNSVFQFESPGMKSMLRDFCPTCFEDLIILVACYRPGPMQYLSDIIAVKNGRKAISYKTPELESILSSTYGAVVYQEQVMEIFQKLAGYSLGGADLVRRAMSKKKMEKLAVERTAFVNGDSSRNIDGCVKRGISAATANSLFDEMMDFAKYAFNKSHAASYALVSYQTAWLKYHYPLEFLCGLFNNKDVDSYGPLFTDCTTYGIRMLPVDINESYYEFVEEDGNIRFGFKGIKGLGEANKDLCDKISERDGGIYKSVNDFLKRLSYIDEEGKKVVLPGKKLLEPLVNSGAFDVFGYNRKILLETLESYRIDVSGADNKKEYANQMIDRLEIQELPKDVAYNMAQEMKYMGKVLSENPLADYGSDESYGCIPIDSMKKGNAVIFGFVTTAELKKSSKGNNMILMTVQGKTGSCTVMAMNALYESYASNIESLEHHVVRISGSVNDGGSMFANEINDLPSDVEEYYLNLDNEEDTEFIADLRAFPQQGRMVKVTIQFHYKRIRSTGKLVRCEPFVMEMMFSEGDIREIIDHGTAITRWSPHRS